MHLSPVTVVFAFVFMTAVAAALLLVLLLVAAAEHHCCQVGVTYTCAQSASRNRNISIQMQSIPLVMPVVNS